MPRACTNPNQSEQLLEHGFRAQAADFWWTPFVWTIPDPNAAPVLAYADRPTLYTEQFTPQDVPAFSLTTLFQALPSSILVDGVTYYLNIAKEQDSYMLSYSNLIESSTYIYRDGFDLIDITVQIIVFLLKNNIPLNSSYIYNNPQ